MCERNHGLVRTILVSPNFPARSKRLRDIKETAWEGPESED